MEPMLKWFVWAAVSKDETGLYCNVPTYVSDIDASDTAAAIVADTLDHLVDDLTRIRLCTDSHLKPVHPALSILSSSTF